MIHPMRATARCSAVARSSRAGPAPRPRSAESSRVDQLRPGRGHDDPDHAVTVKRTHLRFPFNPLLGVISSARPLTAAIGQALVGRVRPGANDRVNEPRSPALPAAARDALLNLVLDTDDGRGNRHQGVRRGWWILLLICTITVPRNPAARTNGQSQRCRGPWVIGGATDRRLVGTVVTAAAENSLPATPIDRATRGRTI